MQLEINCCVQISNKPPCQNILKDIKNESIIRALKWRDGQRDGGRVGRGGEGEGGQENQLRERNPRKTFSHN